MLFYLEGVLVKNYLQKGYVSKINHSQGKTLVDPHENHNATSLEKRAGSIISQRSG